MHCSSFSAPNYRADKINSYSSISYTKSEMPSLLYVSLITSNRFSSLKNIVNAYYEGKKYGKSRIGLFLTNI